MCLSARIVYFFFRAELGLCMYQLENLVQEQLPELHFHFQSQVGVKIVVIHLLRFTYTFHHRSRVFKHQCTHQVGS